MNLWVYSIRINPINRSRMTPISNWVGSWIFNTWQWVLYTLLLKHVCMERLASAIWRIILHYGWESQRFAVNNSNKLCRGDDLRIESYYSQNCDIIFSIKTAEMENIDGMHENFKLLNLLGSRYPPCFCVNRIELVYWKPVATSNHLHSNHFVALFYYA